VGSPPSDEELARRLQAEDTQRVAAAVVPCRFTQAGLEKEKEIAKKKKTIKFALSSCRLVNIA